MRIRCAGISGRRVYVEVGENVKIHPTAMFGTDVQVGDNTRIGASCRVGSHSRIREDVTLYAHATVAERTVLDQTTIGAYSIIGGHSILVQCIVEERVRIGSEASCYTFVIRRGVQIGQRFTARGYNYGKGVPTLAQAIIGDDVEIVGCINVNDSRARYTTTIGNKTKILDSYGASGDFTIAEGVRIGEGCRIEESAVNKSTTIGSSTQIEKAKIGQRVVVGEHVIVRPTVVIPDHWQVPSNCIVNPGMTSPVVVPRTS